MIVEFSSALPSFTANDLWWLLCILILVAAALIIILSKKREETLLTESKRAESLEKLLRVRETERDDALNKCEEVSTQLRELREELDSVTSEYKGLAGITLKELLDFAGVKRENESLKAENSRLYREIASLKIETATGRRLDA